MCRSRLQEAQLSRVACILQKEVPSTEDLQDLMQLLMSSNETVHNAAVEAVRTFADVSFENMRRLAEAGAVPEMVSLLGSSQHSLQVCGARVAAQLARHTPNAKELTEAGFAPAVVPLLESSGQSALVVATLAVRNVASDVTCAAALAEAGVIPPLVRLLESTAEDVQAGAAWAIINMAADVKCAAAFGRAGVIAPVVKLLSSAKESLHYPAAWAALNLLYVADHTDEFIQAEAAGPLVKLLLYSSEAAQEKAAGAIHMLAKSAIGRNRLVEKAGAVAPLLEMLLRSAAPAIQESAAKTVAILSGMEGIAEELLRAGALQRVAVVLQSGNQQSQEAAREALTHLSALATKQAVARQKSLEEQAKRKPKPSEFNSTFWLDISAYMFWLMLAAMFFFTVYKLIRG